MRRVVLVGLISAVSGVVISQVVACVLAVRSPPGVQRIQMAWPEPLPGFLGDTWPPPDTGAVGNLGIGHTLSIVESPLPAPPDFKDDPPKARLWTERFGWPARSAVRYEAILVTHGSNGGATDEFAFYDDFRARAGWRTGLGVPGWLAGLRWPGSVIPVWPIWWGLLANAALYGSVAAACLMAPRWVRRSMRRRRGQCVRCGYDLAGLRVCPECGPVVSAGSRA